MLKWVQYPPRQIKQAYRTDVLSVRKSLVRAENAYAPSFTSETPHTAELSENSISEKSIKGKHFSQKANKKSSRGSSESANHNYYVK